MVAIPVPGAHRVRLSTHPFDLVESLGHAGWRPVLIDGDRCTTKAGLLGEFARSLELPEWFGHNWDALVDAIRERSADGLGVVIDHAEHLGPLEGVLEDIVDELAAEGTPVVLYVRARRPPWRGAPRRPSSG